MKRIMKLFAAVLYISSETISHLFHLTHSSDGCKTALLFLRKYQASSSYDLVIVSPGPAVVGAGCGALGSEMVGAG